VNSSSLTGSVSRGGMPSNGAKFDGIESSGDDLRCHCREPSRCALLGGAVDIRVVADTVSPHYLGAAYH
jgi:hypothetical protein